MHYLQPPVPPEIEEQVEQQVQQITDPIDRLVEGLVTRVPDLISALVIFVIGLYLASLISNTLRRAMIRRDASTQAILLVRKLSYWTILILTLIASLQQLQFDLTAFLTGIGIIGFTIGFALQDVSKNFVSGLILLIQQPFNVGEVVEIAGYGGTVMTIDLRATEISTFDGRVVLIPNGEVLTQAIINYSRAKQRRLQVDSRVPFESDLEAVRKTALNAIRSVPGVLEEPAPQVVFHTFGNSTIDFTLYYWVGVDQVGFLDAQDAGVGAVKEAFEQAGISIPYPVQTLQLLQPNNQLGIKEER